MTLESAGSQAHLDMELAVQIVRGSSGQWRVRLVSSNGRVLSVSENYVTKWNARRAASRMYGSITPVIVDRR
jgi:uncharacterized protein YegP (UPF0339 family)